MTDSSWKYRTEKPPTLAELNTKIEERLTFLENDLRKQGKYFVCGAEQEFFTVDEKDQPTTLDPHALKALLKEKLGKESLIQRVYQEGHSGLGKYEVVLETLHKDFGSFNPSVAIGRAIYTCRHLLSKGHLVDETLPKTSFAAARKHDPKATAGLHINASVYDAEGKNLFCDEKEVLFSTLAKDSAFFLLTLQKEGLAMYAPNIYSYERFRRHESAPGEFSIGLDKSPSSVCLRNSVGQHARGEAELCRMEDRLPEAGTNPYFPILANLGAIWLASTHAKDVPFDTFDEPAEPLSRIPEGNALKKFEQSDLWKTIAGDELHADIIAYCKALQQSHVVAKS